MKFFLFVAAALLLGLIGVIGIYFRFVTVLGSIALEGGRRLFQNGLRSRHLLRHPTYDH